ncbi:MAG: hypothetical protein Q4B60_00920 [Erysipelotrichaceae bacterium]|nr:hypothetical protein [Erysipelotrichaceae bacterium]
MRKLLLIGLLLLSGCSSKVKKEDLYRVNVNGIDVTVGYDSSLDEGIKVEEVNYYTDEKENTYLSDLEFYLSDVSDYVSLDGYDLRNGIKNTCEHFKGELIEKNGTACLISKVVKNRENYVVIYGDLLDDNTDRVDRIEIHYNYAND